MLKDIKIVVSSSSMFHKESVLKLELLGYKSICSIKLIKVDFGKIPQNMRVLTLFSDSNKLCFAQTFSR